MFSSFPWVRNGCNFILHSLIMTVSPSSMNTFNLLGMSISITFSKFYPFTSHAFTPSFYYIYLSNSSWKCILVISLFTLVMITLSVSIFTINLVIYLMNFLLKFNVPLIICILKSKLQKSYASFGSNGTLISTVAPLIIPCLLRAVGF